MEDKKVISALGSSITEHKNKRIAYNTGDILGNHGITFVEEAEPVIKKKSAKSTRLVAFRKAVFKCHCGNLFTTQIQQVKMNKTKSCGCLRIAKTKEMVKNRNKKATI